MKPGPWEIISYYIVLASIIITVAVIALWVINEWLPAAPC